MPKRGDRISNEHKPKTDREYSEIWHRPFEYDYYNGGANLIRVGPKSFPYTVKGKRSAQAYARATVQPISEIRRKGKG